MTLNYRQLDAKWLDRAVDWLNERGVHTYAVLEEWEMPDFKDQFAGARRLAALDRPIAIYEYLGKLMIFDLSGPGLQSAKPVVVRGIAGSRSAVPPVSLPQLVFARVP